MTIEWRSYAATDNTYDELIDRVTGPRPAAGTLCGYLASLSDEELRERKLAAELAILVMGITFTVYTEGGSIDRAWPFDIVPRIIPRNFPARRPPSRRRRPRRGR